MANSPATRRLVTEAAQAVKLAEIAGLGGVPGPEGPLGPPGPSGPQGTAGPAGPKGDPGAKGNTGATGPEGSQGPRGLQGLKGDPGAVGATGPEGPQGPQGIQGPAGPAGSGDGTGEPIPGPEGPQGPQGVQGPVGPVGPKGDPGDPGTDGAEGAQGIQGPAGDDGAQGPQGMQGLQGIQGIQGPTGATGPKGDTGAAGPTGPKGAPDGVYSVRLYGATGNGATDDTAAIASALTALTAAGGGELYFGPGRYRVGTGVSRAVLFALPANTLVRGCGKGVSVLVQDATANVSAIFGIDGSVGPWVNTTNSPGPTGTNIGAPGHGLAANDLFVLADNFSYTTTDASYKSGEMLRVGSISGDTITVRGFITGSWAGANGQYTTANTARVAKVTPVSGVKLCDLTIQGRTDVATSGIRAQWVNNLTVDGFEMDGGVVGVFINGCRNVTLTNLSVQDLRDDIANGFAGYGVAVFGPCKSVKLTAYHAARVRHAITTLGGNYGFVHDLKVADSSATETTSTPWDTHAAGDDVTFDNLTSTASPRGVLIRSRNATVQNCHLQGRAFDAEPGLFVGETNAKDVIFKNNRVEGFAIGCHIINSAEGGFTVEGNHFENIGAVCIGVNSSAPNVRICNNVLINWAQTTTQQPGIQNYTPSGSLASGLTWVISNNVLIMNTGTAGNPILTTFASMVNVLVINNLWSGTYAYGIGVTATTSRNNVKVDTAWPTVTGAKSGNAALTSLLAQLAAQGFITNSTT